MRKSEFLNSPQYIGDVERLTYEIACPTGSCN
jgi:hypothetical protein